MAENNDSLISLLHLLNKVENDLVKAKAMVQKMFEEAGNTTPFESVPVGGSQMQPVQEDEPMQTVEGKFDGTFMVANDGKMYPVPMNYASKTKLIPGDMLKLRIMEDGKLIYKVI